MRPFGFSTGALARGDFLAGLAALRHVGVRHVELSALREEELAPLLAWLEDADLSDMAYVSVHAPSVIRPAEERAVVQSLLPLRDRGWAIVVHADVIHTPATWRALGCCLCVENTDKRKPSGRGFSEMATIFAPLPEATFCLDLGHARQVDPTMSQAYFMLKEFGRRLRQVHLSEVNTQSRHERLSEAAVISFADIASEIPTPTPIILESIVPPDAVRGEIDFARRALPIVESEGPRRMPVARLSA
jgi:hypothetical protein